MPYNLNVEALEIDELLEACKECAETGESLAPEFTYEEGILAAVGWLLGLTDAHPFDDDADEDDLELEDDSEDDV